MGRVTGRWAGQECRTEDGIYFSDDTFVPVVANVPQPCRRCLAELEGVEPEGWCSLHIGEPLARLAGHVVFGGETSLEGAGFIALARESDGSLLWLLHSSEAEGYRSASIVDGAIVAVSQEHPETLEWRIPLERPWELVMIRTAG